MKNWNAACKLLLLMSVQILRRSDKLLIDCITFLKVTCKSQQKSSNNFDRIKKYISLLKNLK
jgi:hypothetical protein